MMSPQKSEPTGLLLEAINNNFESIDQFKKKFSQAADLGLYEHFDFRLKFYYQLYIEPITSSVSDDVVS